jgi:schlafen family protein
MTISDLQRLLEEIRNGRLEGVSLDFKRQWWDLGSEKGKSEFRRDVTSIANSADEAGIIILGFKNADLYDAPPTRDEAELQQILRLVSPLPKVKLERFSIEGKTISVLSIDPPFDRPYVLRSNDQHSVPVRHGSSIGTASRFELDAFYAQRNPKPRLEATWAHWKPGTLGVAGGNPKSSAVLPILHPKIRASEIPEFFGQQLQHHRSDHSRTGYPTTDLLAEFEVQMAAFISSLEQPSNLIHWYLKSFPVFHQQTDFTVRFRNVGTQPAIGAKLKVRFPNWILLNHAEPNRPASYVNPPYIPPPPRPPSPRSESRVSKAPDYGLLLSNIPFTQPSRKSSGSHVTDALAAIFWAEKVLQDHSCTVDDRMSAIALPTAPQAPSAIDLSALVFCEEQEAWQPIQLQIELVDTQDEQLGTQATQ